MKYLLMVGGDPLTREDVGGEDSVSIRSQVSNWWRQHRDAGILMSGARLHGPATATTVRFEQGRAIIEDGPFCSEDDAVGGLGIIEAEDLDEVLRIVLSWPTGGYIEIRPVVPGTFTGTSDHQQTTPASG